MAKRFCTGSALVLVALSATACGDHHDAADGPIPWIGHTYMLSIDKGDYTVPSHIGSDLYGIAPAFFFKIDGSGTELTATLGTGPGTTTDADMVMQLRTPDDATQDSCGPTAVIQFSAADYPHSTLALDDARIFLVNPATPPVQDTADVYGLRFTDILPNGDAPSKTGKLDATMDFGQLFVLFSSLGPTRTVDSVCAALSRAYTPSTCMDSSCAVTCTTCPTASASDTCLSVEATEIGALDASNVTITDVTEADRPSTCADSQLDPG